MQNKPKYSFFKNARYAIDGFIEAFKKEFLFRIELILTPILIIVLVSIQIPFCEKLILFFTWFLLLIIELINSAIENVVDLITKDFHPLAKNAKDMGAAACLFALLLHIGYWIVILINYNIF